MKLLCLPVCSLCAALWTVQSDFLKSVHERIIIDLFFYRSGDPVFSLRTLNIIIGQMIDWVESHILFGPALCGPPIHAVVTATAAAAVAVAVSSLIMSRMSNAYRWKTWATMDQPADLWRETFDLDTIEILWPLEVFRGAWNPSRSASQCCQGSDMFMLKTITKTFFQDQDS